ncbi:uncharacterized protein MELLADRAFT_107045 [Melampsora larici-populina 98AG31]|uniref:Uncharacterized protein n=1 Tax=Melampsora larici-populina (strain 98AG31 / pathotype 3-4-7) TaxID=747676 RepID=F4RNH2_MELLP|nr:uncharacterized protein MELLADRAFT_107045 [Melampsora larici-populina 98AG31]EGG06097.1 hypothetical protein MELLADRAFT_107045 [Melampsora larici-populina 98AG31]
MSSQPTCTLKTPNAGGTGKKCCLEEEDHSDGDGDLTHEEVLEQKQNITAKLKALTQIRHRNEGIGKVAGHHPVPKAATPFARAIHEFVKILMGIQRKSRGSSALEDASLKKMPDPPTEEERHAWENRRQRREKQHCCKPPGSTSPLVWQQGPKISRTKSKVAMKSTPEGQKTLEDNVAIAKSITSKQRNMTKIYEARVYMAAKFFVKDSPEAAMLSHPKVQSKDELVSSNSCGSRQKLRLEWRSKELDTLIGLLDTAYWKRKTIPKERRSAKQQEVIVLSELELDENNKVDIWSAIEDSKITFKSLSVLAAEQNGASGSNGMNTQQQNGPSGYNYVMNTQ